MRITRDHAGNLPLRSAIRQGASWVDSSSFSVLYVQGDSTGGYSGGQSRTVPLIMLARQHAVQFHGHAVKSDGPASSPGGTVLGREQGALREPFAECGQARRVA